MEWMENSIKLSYYINELIKGIQQVLHTNIFLTVSLIKFINLAL